MRLLERPFESALAGLIFVVTIGAGSATAATTPPQDSARAARFEMDRTERAESEQRLQKDRAAAQLYVNEHGAAIAGDKNSEFRERIAVPAGGLTVVRFTQVYRGIPVYAAELILTVSDGVVSAKTSAIKKSLELSTVSKVTKADAMKFARAAPANRNLQGVRRRARDRPSAVVRRGATYRQSCVGRFFVRPRQSKDVQQGCIRGRDTRRHHLRCNRDSVSF